MRSSGQRADDNLSYSAAIAYKDILLVSSEVLRYMFVSEHIRVCPCYGYVSALDLRASGTHIYKRLNMNKSWPGGRYMLSCTGRLHCKLRFVVTLW